MALDFKKLNNEQIEAVLFGNGPLLIVAGAGTGKTTVITQRIVNLIDPVRKAEQLNLSSSLKDKLSNGVEKQIAKPEEILALTFTEKAASEMEERVDRLLEYGYVDLWILTFHSFCERILRENGLDIGLSPDFKILDQTSGWLLARQNLDKFNLDYYKALGNPTKFIQALISHFSHCKDQEIYPEDYLKYADDLKTRDDSPDNSEIERIKEVANAFFAYQQILLQNNALDFGDLINYCLKLFKKRPLILKKYREKFKYILVDEFQDTNWSQYELVKLLAEPKNNLCVCADDDQAIYRWRGASFSNIVQFGKDFPEAKKISLIKNYRSSQNILDQSYKFIKQNDPDRLEFVNKISKKLVAENNTEGVIAHLHAKSLEQETGAVVKKILEILKNDKGAVYNDFAILVRANDHAIPFIRVLERAGLPYQYLASKGLYSKPVILDVISYFKILDNYHEGSAVYRVLNLPVLEITDTEIAKITEYSRRKTKSLFEALQELPLIYNISPKTQEKVVFIMSLIKKHNSMAREKGVSEIFTAFLEDSGYLKYLIAKEQTEKIDLLNQFYKKIKTFEETNIEPGLKNFMQEMNLELESGEEGKLEFDPEQGPDMIKVMTIHGAKGLEFKYVFLVNMVDRRFPTDQRKDLIELPEELIKDIKPKGDTHLQEERRLCYVAMTRAKSRLYFTSALDYGGQKKKKLSRFLAEMGYKEETKNSIAESENELITEKIKAPLLEKVKQEYMPDHFSYSQLAAFQKCPLQYKFNFILKVPVRGKAVFSFGHSMHNTLHMFLKEANSAPEQKELFSVKTKQKDMFKELEKIFEKSWVGEWYESKNQKEEYYKLGKKIIRQFYEEYEKNPPKILKINNDPALEVDFNFKIKGNTIKGKIDRIDDLGLGHVALIDYKTGKAKEKLDFDEKEQLLIYQMAAEQVLNLKPKELTFYYLDDNKKISFLGSEKDIEAQKEKLIKLIEQIKSSQFGPTPGWNCQYCDFKDICDFAKR